MENKENKEDYEDRLIAEYNELVERINKLGSFISANNVNLSPKERRLLTLQLNIMEAYQRVLMLRLDIDVPNC